MLYFCHERGSRNDQNKWTILLMRCGEVGTTGYDASSGTGSDDAFANWKRNRENHDVFNGYNDMISQRWKGYNRGRIPEEVMYEIGFQDCDYISMESDHRQWKKIKTDVGAPLELHVPCREPITMLMSMCNYQEVQFDCERAKTHPDEAIRNCTIEMSRFSYKMKTYPETTLKCFNPFPVQNYISYMSQSLHRKRLENPYVRRDTNKPRNKTTECIWKDSGLQQRVRQRLIILYDYFSFCNSCMNSSEELALDLQQNND